MRVPGSCGPQADLLCSRKRGRERVSRGKDNPLSSHVTGFQSLPHHQHVATVKRPCPGERGDEARRRGLGTNVMMRVRHTPGASEGSMALLPLLGPECVVKESGRLGHHTPLRGAAGRGEREGSGLGSEESALTIPYQTLAFGLKRDCVREGETEPRDPDREMHTRLLPAASGGNSHLRGRQRGRC